MKNDSSYRWDDPPFQKWPAETVDSMAEIGEAFMDALPKDYSWLQSPAEIIADLQNERDELLAALREARSNLRHAQHCRSNQPMVPPQGFNRYPCDCGSDHAREVATAAIAKAEGRGT